jgi:hypothetical protein
MGFIVIVDRSDKMDRTTIVDGRKSGLVTWCCVFHAMNNEITNGCDGNKRKAAERLRLGSKWKATYL